MRLFKTRLKITTCPMLWPSHVILKGEMRVINSKFLTRPFLIFLISLLPIYNFAQDYKKTVITDPGISRRCGALMKQRTQKIDHKQKLGSLIERNRRLIKITPPERKTLVKKLRKTFKSLKRELRLTLNQIQNKEENIIRKGCPGITL